MATAQMNVRMDAALKEGGDHAFAQIGYTPTDVVRLMWSFAARNQGDAARTRRLIESLKEGSEDGIDDEAARRLKAMKRALHYREEYYAARGWELPAPYAKTSQEEHEAALGRQVEKDRQLLDDTLAERYSPEEVAL